MRKLEKPALRKQRTERYLVDRKDWSERIISMMRSLDKKEDTNNKAQPFDLNLYPWQLSSEYDKQNTNENEETSWANQLIETAKCAVKNSRLPFAVMLESAKLNIINFYYNPYYYDLLEHLGFKMVLPEFTINSPVYRFYRLYEKDGLYVLYSQSQGGNGVPSDLFESEEKKLITKIWIKICMV